MSALDAADLLRQGAVDEALAALQARVRAEPADAKLRVFLFQLLCVNGAWERALTQLAVAGDLDAGTLGMVQVYREAVRNEALRRDVFAGLKSPLVFGEPERWIALLLEALKRTAQGDAAGARSLRESAFDEAAASSGTIDSDRFEWIADGDSRLGPVLEAIVHGRYYWIPFNRIASIRIEPPEDLRDIVWLRSIITWTNGGSAHALLPSRYPGTETHDDPLVRLARRTEWREDGEGGCFGIGQRMLYSDANEYPLLDVRLVEFDSGDGVAGDG